MILNYCVATEILIVLANVRRFSVTQKASNRNEIQFDHFH